jgi:hypothetical protein
VWEVRVEAGCDPLTQRRRQVSRTVRGTKRDAEKVLNQLNAEADEGEHTGTDATFKEVAERWLRLTEGLHDLRHLPPLGCSLPASPSGPFPVGSATPTRYDPWRVRPLRRGDRPTCGREAERADRS